MPLIPLGRPHSTGSLRSWRNPAGVGQAAQREDKLVVGQLFLLIIPLERQSEEDDVLAHIRRGEKVDHFETVRQAKDGRKVDISLTVSPVKDAQGRIIGASKVARDITERKRAEVERARLTARNRQPAELRKRPTG